MYRLFGGSGPVPVPAARAAACTRLRRRRVDRYERRPLGARPARLLLDLPRRRAGGVRRAVGPGLEHRPRPVHRAAARADRLHAPALAAALARRAGGRARRRLESHADRRRLRAVVAPTRGRCRRTGSRRSSYLHAHLSPSYRVEAVDTTAALARGVPARCGDPDRARLVPAERLPAERAALRQQARRARRTSRGCAQLGVRYVVHRRATPDYSSRLEAQLIRGGRSGLVPVFRSPHVSVYELPHATPMVTGPGLASIVWLYPSRAVLEVEQARHVPRRPALVAVLAHPARVRREGRRRHGARARRAEPAWSICVRADVSRGLDALAGVKPAGSCG